MWRGWVAMPARRGTTRLRDVSCPPQELTLTTPDEPVTELLPRLSDCADGRALVVTDDHLIGIILPSDISRMVQRAALEQANAGSVR